MDHGPTEDHGPATSNQVVDPENGTHRAQLAAAANRGADALLGEAPLPRFRWDQPGTFALCEALRGEAMPFAFARDAVFTATSSRTTEGGQAPRSLRYYVPIVVKLRRE